MEIINKEFKVYQFDELNKEVQDELIEKEGKFMEEVYLDHTLEEDMNEQAYNLLEPILGECVEVKVYYDLSYCQGSGAMMEYNASSINFLHEAIKFSEDKELMEWFDANVDNIDFTCVIKHSGHYYHEYSYTHDMDLGSEVDYRVDVEEVVDSFIVHLNTQLYEIGKAYVEWYWNKNNWLEDALDNLNENKYLEDGTVWED